MNGSVVVDSSAFLELLGTGPDAELIRRLRTSLLIAPEIFDLEVLHVLRRQVREDPAITETLTPRRGYCRIRR